MRDVTVTSTQGYCIEFKAKEAVEVPEAVVADCAAKGCMPAEDLEDLLTETPVVISDRLYENNQPKIIEAIELMVARNAEGDFTADKLPNTKALIKEVGFKVSVKERNEAWETVQKRLGD